MSFVTAIRDYGETLNIISDSLSQNVTLPGFIYATFLYFLKTLQNGLVYIVSFQWIRDFTLLPIVLPQFSSSLFKETFFLETPSKIFFEFLEIPDLHQNKLLLGFFNSFFLSLPLSVIHIITIRRLLIQGIPSGVLTIAGYLAGQLLFLTCTVFGIREIILPWLTLEPVNYLIGLILIFRIIYQMAGEQLVELPDWSNPKFWSTPAYKTYFLTSFLIAWCEQTSVFQYLGNLTLSSNVTILESFSSTSSISSFFTHSLYLVGIACGSVFFTGLWGFFFFQVKNWVIFYTPLFTSSFIQWTNKTSFVLVLALTLTSIPFYGVEYIITGPLGFVSQDSLFKNTPLDQNRVKDYARGTTGLSGVESNFQYIDLDLSPFDRGEYLTLTPPDVAEALSFEDLNYRSEFDWTTRNNKVSGITDSRGGFFTLSKIFKKQKKTQTEIQSTLQEKLETNRLLSDTAPVLGGTDLDTNSEIVKRYIEFYDRKTDDLENFSIPYKSLSTASFPSDFLRKNSQFESQIEQKIKENYYSNPVYKSLLALDIDLFLKRQPENFQLNASQELDLYTKRKMLECYYDSLRSYSQLPYSDIFDAFFDGAKSFSNKVYNQQFRGTLRSVRRLFAVRLDSENKEQEGQTLLKFDQPLYQFTEKQLFSPYHEELKNQSKTPEELAKKGDFPQTYRFEENREKIEKRNNFLNTPLYAGWDEHLRKFVITNKFLPRTLAGYKVQVEPEIRGDFQPSFSKKTEAFFERAKQGQKIKFAVWPLSNEKLQKTKTESPVPFVTLYKYVDEKSREGLGNQDFVTLPANLEIWEFQQSRNEKGKEQKLPEPSLVPKRGGFVWPGNSKLKLPSFSN
jgi:hypothetical protein